MLAFLVTWNTNSRNCHEAQAVIETLLKHEAPDSLLQYSGIKSAVESLLPYTGEWWCGDIWAVGGLVWVRAAGRCLWWWCAQYFIVQSQLPSAPSRFELCQVCALDPGVRWMLVLPGLLLPAWAKSFSQLVCLWGLLCCECSLFALVKIDFVPISGELSFLWYQPLVFFLCRAPLSEAEPITASLHVHWLHVAKHEAGWYITAGRYDFVTLLPPAAVSWGDRLNCFPTRYGNWNIPLFYNKLYNFFQNKSTIQSLWSLMRVRVHSSRQAMFSLLYFHTLNFEAWTRRWLSLEKRQSGYEQAACLYKLKATKLGDTTCPVVSYPKVLLGCVCRSVLAKHWIFSWLGPGCILPKHCISPVPAPTCKHLPGNWVQL